MDMNQQFSADMPATYRIRVMGHLEQSGADRYCENTRVSYESEGAELATVLLFTVSDQAHLLGIVNALYNTGHAVISLEQVAAPDEPDSSGPDTLGPTQSGQPAAT